MANRYWVGGTATWNSTAGSKWSTTSGGVSGAAAPTASDNVFLDSNSGSGVITLTSAVCNDLNTTGFQGTINGTTLTVSGNLTLGTDATYTLVNQTTFNGTTTTITNSVVWLGTWLVNSTGSLTLGDDVDISNSLSQTGGSIDLNGFTLRASRYGTASTGTFNLSLNGGDLILRNTTFTVGVSTFDAMSPDYTFSGSGGRILFYPPSASAQGGLITIETIANLDCELIFPDRSEVAILEDCTFSNLFSFEQPGSRLELAGNVVFTPEFEFRTVLTDGLWSLIIVSPPGTQRTITQTSGFRTFSNLAFQDINFTGGASFTAENCIDLGNVAGIEIESTASIQPIIPRGENYFLYAETSGPTDTNPFGTSTED